MARPPAKGPLTLSWLQYTSRRQRPFDDTSAQINDKKVIATEDHLLYEQDVQEQDQKLAALVVSRSSYGAGWRLTLGFRRLLGNSRGVVAMEFAILAVPFFILTLGVMEISYDLFTQSALDLSLETAVRALQVGKAQSLVQNGPGAATSNQEFLSQYLCPAMGLMLECKSNVFIKIQTLSSAPACASGVADYSCLATGVVPTVGYAFDDSSFTGTSSFCNVQKKQFILVSAVYLGPSFIGGLLPHVLSLTYNGNIVHATLSTLGVATEQFSSSNSTSQPPSGTTVLAPC